MTDPTQPAQAVDLAIVGGGLAGLTAAAVAARNGLSVRVYEKAAVVGGRAQTQDHDGFRLNLGPHALYRLGAGMRILGELGIQPKGGVPSTSGGHAIRGSRTHMFPGGPASLITTGLLPLGAKLETARFLATIQSFDPTPWLDVAVSDTLQGIAVRNETRQLLAAVLRLSTYANDPDRQSGGVALAQLKLALDKSVLYIENGWQTLVDELRAVVEQAGVEIECGASVVGVTGDDVATGIRLRGGASVPARAVLLATGPSDASALVGSGTHPTLARWANDSIAVRAATFDVALTKLPRPRSTFALGIDQPLYYSVHSAAAPLAPGGGAMLHVAKYLSPFDGNAAEVTRAELEATLELVQPGWREHLVHQRFLPHVIVDHGLATAGMGGLGGRPGPEVPGMRMLYVAGDWVGPEGLLADASFASAHQAAQRATAALAATGAAAA